MAALPGPVVAAVPVRDPSEASGLRCRLCGLDEVPWPRTAYCSERCRRHAAYLARKHRRRGPDRLEDGTGKTRRPTA